MALPVLCQRKAVVRGSKGAWSQVKWVVKCLEYWERGRFSQKSGDSYLNQREARVFGFNHVLGRLETHGDRLESKNYVHHPELTVSMEENFRLQNLVKVCKIH